MLINTACRSTKTEIMDDLFMKGDMLKKNLAQIAAINRRLGGNQATIQGLHTLIQYEQKETVISIADLGCGNGDMLRAIAILGRKNKLRLHLVGIDANEYTIQYAEELSAAFPEISYIKIDVLSAEFLAMRFDVILATLFLHHFTDRQIEELLAGCIQNTRLGMVVNDLHRSRVAYYLFKVLSLFIKNPITKNDGAVSILRGFKKNELISTSKKISNTASTIRWKWAFRYQWIIKKHGSKH